MHSFLVGWIIAMAYLQALTKNQSDSCSQTVKLGSADHMNQDSVTALPLPCLKCFQKHILVYCLAVEVEGLLQLVGGA